MNLDLGQPNALILVRVTLCYSQMQLADKLGISKDTIIRAETGKIELRKLYQLALKGLYTKEALNYPGIAKTLTRNNPDDFVELLMESNTSRTQFIRVNRPTCTNCDSTDIEVDTIDKTSCRKIQLDCNSCGITYESRSTPNLLRLLQIRKPEGADLVDSKLFRQRLVEE